MDTCAGVRNENFDSPDGLNTSTRFSRYSTRAWFAFGCRTLMRSQAEWFQ